MPGLHFTLGPDGTGTGKTPDGEFKAKLTVDASKKPRTMDISHDGGDHDGKKKYAIYKLDGKKLVIASTPPGPRRATGRRTSTARRRATS